MTIKVLEPPLRVGDSFIVAVDGHLRFVDPSRGKPRCMGYQNCCQCGSCLERELREIVVVAPNSCRCDHPIRASDSSDCFKCGRMIRELQEAA